MNYRDEPSLCQSYHEELVCRRVLGHVGDHSAGATAWKNEDLSKDLGINRLFDDIDQRFGTIDRELDRFQQLFDRSLEQRCKRFVQQISAWFERRSKR